MADGGAEKRAILRGKQLQANVNGSTKTVKSQPSTHLEPRNGEAASKALPEARQAGLSRPHALFLHSPFGLAIVSCAEVSIRCKCCDDACILYSTPTSGYAVQRKGKAAAVSEQLSSEEMTKQHGVR